MSSMMAASARKRKSAIPSTAVENMLNSSGPSSHPLRETLPHFKLLRVLSIIQQHALSHAFVGLAVDAEISRRHAKTRKDIPQKPSG